MPTHTPSHAPLALTLALACALALSAGCDPAKVAELPPSADVQDTSPGPLPPCPETGTLYVLDSDLVRGPLTSGAPLGVILGFQGFQFAQVGLVSPVPLDNPARVSVFVDSGDKLALHSVSPALRPTKVDGGWETPAVLVFFNDVPLAELVGLTATLTLRADAGDCALSASVDVQLTTGGYTGEDSPVWADATNLPDAGAGD
ncbi:MAG: hypothetical protein R3F39_22520 [Myxococcota bacterium]